MGKTFPGPRAVLKQSRHSFPKSKAPRFRLRPTIVCGNRRKRIELLQALKAWRAEYRGAWESRCKGNREVEFPYGTYEMRVVHGARCAAAAPS